MNKVRITIILSEDDHKLLEQLVIKTGAYSISEAVRDAIRQAYRKVLVAGSVPRVTEERIP